jgi:LPPG:FO 2-phospho-L-lactate transferase
MASHDNGGCVAISGGVGGAKLALGLSRILPPARLTIVANTGDDFEHLGFFISPDLDTVMYTLADVANKEVGWGQAGETWHFLAALERLGGESWFRLGDRDLATHVVRTRMLREGSSLSEATTHLCRALGVEHPLVPMSDDSIPTVVVTRGGERLGFQHYFVRDRCAPEVTGFEFSGIDAAEPAPGFVAALASPELAAIVICPSNPFVSVDPVLNIPGIMDRMRASAAAVVAVSPIVGGQALKGPAAKMMKELGMPQSALAVAKHYRGRIDGLVLDARDAELRDAVEAEGIATLVTDTVMVSLQDRIDLAEATFRFACELPARTG